MLSCLSLSMKPAATVSMTTSQSADGSEVNGVGKGIHVRKSSRRVNDLPIIGKIDGKELVFYKNAQEARERNGIHANHSIVTRDCERHVLHPEEFDRHSVGITFKYASKEDLEFHDGTHLNQHPLQQQQPLRLKYPEATSSSSSFQPTSPLRVLSTPQEEEEEKEVSVVVNKDVSKLKAGSRRVALAAQQNAFSGKLTDKQRRDDLELREASLTATTTTTTTTTNSNITDDDKGIISHGSRNASMAKRLVKSGVVAKKRKDSSSKALPTAVDAAVAAAYVAYPESHELPDDSVCARCGNGEDYPGNIIIGCEACDYVVHQQCYYSPATIPLLSLDEPWFCSVSCEESWFCRYEKSVKASAAIRARKKQKKQQKGTKEKKTKAQQQLQGKQQKPQIQQEPQQRNNRNRKKIEGSVESGAGKTIPLDRNADIAVAVYGTNYANGIDVGNGSVHLSSECAINFDDCDDRKVGEEEEEDIVCWICKRGDSAEPNCILICEGCDYALHQWCASPVLETVPETDWYCDVCASPQSSSSSSSYNKTTSELALAAATTTATATTTARSGGGGDGSRSTFVLPCTAAVPNSASNLSSPVLNKERRKVLYYSSGSSCNSSSNSSVDSEFSDSTSVVNKKKSAMNSILKKRKTMRKTPVLCNNSPSVVTKGKHTICESCGSSEGNIFQCSFVSSLPSTSIAIAAIGAMTGGGDDRISSARRKNRSMPSVHQLQSQQSQQPPQQQLGRCKNWVHPFCGIRSTGKDCKEPFNHKYDTWDRFCSVLCCQQAEKAASSVTSTPSGYMAPTEGEIAVSSSSSSSFSSSAAAAAAASTGKGGSSSSSLSPMLLASLQRPPVGSSSSSSNNTALLLVVKESGSGSMEASPLSSTSTKSSIRRRIVGVKPPIPPSARLGRTTTAAVATVTNSNANVCANAVTTAFGSEVECTTGGTDKMKSSKNFNGSGGTAGSLLAAAAAAANNWQKSRLVTNGSCSDSDTSALSDRESGSEDTSLNSKNSKDNTNSKSNIRNSAGRKTSCSKVRKNVNKKKMDNQKSMAGSCSESDNDMSVASGQSNTSTGTSVATHSLISRHLELVRSAAAASAAAATVTLVDSDSDNSTIVRKKQIALKTQSARSAKTVKKEPRTVIGKGIAAINSQSQSQSQKSDCEQSKTGEQQSGFVAPLSSSSSAGRNSFESLPGIVDALKMAAKQQQRQQRQWEQQRATAPFSTTSISSVPASSFGNKRKRSTKPFSVSEPSAARAPDILQEPEHHEKDVGEGAEEDDEDEEEEGEEEEEQIEDKPSCNGTGEMSSFRTSSNGNHIQNRASSILDTIRSYNVFYRLDQFDSKATPPH